MQPAQSLCCATTDTLKFLTDILTEIISGGRLCLKCHTFFEILCQWSKQHLYRALEYNIIFPLLKWLERGRVVFENRWQAS